MSKYEPRHAEIKAAFAAHKLAVSWTNRRSGLFMSVKPLDGEDPMFGWDGLVKKFYPEAYMTSGGGESATWRVKGAVASPKVDNSLKLEMHGLTPADKVAEIRANAVFILGKLVAGGMCPRDAKTAVEKLYVYAFDQGYEVGADSGFEDGYASGADASSNYCQCHSF